MKVPTFQNVSAFEKSAISGERLRRRGAIHPNSSKTLTKNGRKPEGAHLLREGGAA